ncbi:MAG: hypothetical protein ACOY3N_05770 [Bradyrhizobium sp.]
MITGIIMVPTGTIMTALTIMAGSVTSTLRRASAKPLPSASG